MYGIFTYIWAIFRVNVVKYSMHGAYGFRLETTMILEIPQEAPSQENGGCLGQETRILARPSWTNWTIKPCCGKNRSLKWLVERYGLIWCHIQLNLFIHVYIFLRFWTYILELMFVLNFVPCFPQGYPPLRPRASHCQQDSFWVIFKFRRLTKKRGKSDQQA